MSQPMVVTGFKVEGHETCICPRIPTTFKHDDKRPGLFVHTACLRPTIPVVTVWLDNKRANPAKRGPRKGNRLVTQAVTRPIPRPTNPAVTAEAQADFHEALGSTSMAKALRADAKKARKSSKSTSAEEAPTVSEKPTPRKSKKPAPRPVEVSADTLTRMVNKVVREQVQAKAAAMQPKADPQVHPAPDPDAQRRSKSLKAFSVKGIEVPALALNDVNFDEVCPAKLRSLLNKVRFRLESGTPLPSEMTMRDYIDEHRRLRKVVKNFRETAPPKGAVEALMGKQAKDAGRAATVQEASKPEIIQVLLDPSNAAKVKALTALGMDPQAIATVLVSS